MKPIAETVESMFASQSMQEDEYLNEDDGLTYCSKCHTPRQHKVQWKDKVMLPTVRCQCQQAEYEKQEAHAYITHWNEMKAKSIGLLLLGDVGTGKSFFAGCIANALLEQGIPVLERKTDGA